MSVGVPDATLREPWNPLRPSSSSHSSATRHRAEAIASSGAPAPQLRPARRNHSDPQPISSSPSSLLVLALCVGPLPARPPAPPLIEPVRLFSYSRICARSSSKPRPLARPPPCSALSHPLASSHLFAPPLFRQPFTPRGTSHRPRSLWCSAIRPPPQITSAPPPASIAAASGRPHRARPRTPSIPRTPTSPYAAGYAVDPTARHRRSRQWIPGQPRSAPARVASRRRGQAQTTPRCARPRRAQLQPPGSRDSPPTTRDRPRVIICHPMLGRRSSHLPRPSTPPPRPAQRPTPPAHRPESTPSSATAAPRASSPALPVPITAAPGQPKTSGACGPTVAKRPRRGTTMPQVSPAPRGPPRIAADGPLWRSGRGRGLAPRVSLRRPPPVRALLRTAFLDLAPLIRAAPADRAAPPPAPGT